MLETDSKFEILEKLRIDKKREAKQRGKSTTAAMATKSSNMKGFYRQTKSNKTGIAKPSMSKSKSVKLSAEKALVSHGCPDFLDDRERDELVLQQFDMNMAYGPCLGMTRMARWERAKRLGMNPPDEIVTMLKSEKVDAECLWNGRI